MVFDVVVVGVLLYVLVGDVVVVDGVCGLFFIDLLVLLW